MSTIIGIIVSVLIVFPYNNAGKNMSQIYTSELQIEVLLYLKYVFLIYFNYYSNILVSLLELFYKDRYII